MPSVCAINVQAEASSDYIAGLALLPGEAAAVAAAADGRLSLLDVRAGSKPLAAQVHNCTEGTSSVHWRMCRCMSKDQMCMCTPVLDFLWLTSINAVTDLDQYICRRWHVVHR